MTALTTLVAICLWTLVTAAPQDQQDKPVTTFRGGVDLVNITATVHDGTGRFVPDLTQDDFVVYEDNHPQPITYFSSDRVPVSLGLVVDTSNSMAGEKIVNARSALQQFFNTLLEKERDEDEIFVYRFSDEPRLLQDWTSDRGELALALRRLSPDGGTAMYDAVEEGLHKAARGRHTKKALVVISDGNDTSSRSGLSDVLRATRASEALVYAIGLDSTAPVSPRQMPPPRLPFPIPPQQPPFPVPSPFPRPGLVPGRPGGTTVMPQRTSAAQVFGGQSSSSAYRVNVRALRQLTDESGGHAEIVRDPRDLNRATTSIANELTRQYSLAYAASVPRDGSWHTIRVELRRPGYTVRARRGYYAN